MSPILQPSSKILSGEKKDNCVYQLIDKNPIKVKIPGVLQPAPTPDEIVYIGRTNDPEDRERQHRLKGWDFTSLKIISAPMTEREATIEEIGQLTRYYAMHKRLPKYNKRIG